VRKEGGVGVEGFQRAIDIRKGPNDPTGLGRVVDAVDGMVETGKRGDG
jgi:hypothetical protein